MRFGVFTPTEAAVVAVVYAIAVGIFIYRELTLRLLYQCLIDAAKTTSIVMLLVSAAFVSGWLITVANLPEQLGGLLKPFLEHPRLLVLVMIGIVVVVGDRKSVVKGKSVSVRVDLGGRRIIEKKKSNT